MVTIIRNFIIDNAFRLQIKILKLNVAVCIAILTLKQFMFQFKIIDLSTLIKSVTFICLQFGEI